MGYNENIDKRIKSIVGGWSHAESKKMFGGVCHLLNGHMFCGVYQDYLILRLGEAETSEAMESPYARPFDITGRPMKGWIMLDQKGFPTKKDLTEWLMKARQFADTLPPK